jgi:hypothetical protein
MTSVSHVTDLYTTCQVAVSAMAMECSGAMNGSYDTPTSEYNCTAVSPFILKTHDTSDQIRGGHPHYHLGVNGYHGWQNTMLASHIVSHITTSSTQSAKHVMCARTMVGLMCGERGACCGGNRFIERCWKSRPVKD